MQVLWWLWHHPWYSTQSYTPDNSFACHGTSYKSWWWRCSKWKGMHACYRTFKASSCVGEKLLFRSRFWDQFANWSLAIQFLASIKRVVETRLMYVWTVWPPHILLLHYTLTMHAGMVCLFWSKLAWDSSSTGKICCSNSFVWQRNLYWSNF